MRHHRQKDETRSGQGIGFQSKAINRQTNHASLVTAPCYCGIGARRAYTCITCLGFNRYMGQVEARQAARGAQ